MEGIMPNLEAIVQGIKNIMSLAPVEIHNIYITGMGVVINNIDLYFQENFTNQACTILKPYFVQQENMGINIKDYIEVNSAIALALQGLGEGKREVNFVKSKLGANLTSRVSENASKAGKDITSSDFLRSDLGEKLTTFEKNLVRIGVGIATVMVLYIISLIMIMGQIENRSYDAQQYIARTEETIQAISEDTKRVQTRTSDYESILARLDENRNSLNQNIARRNIIPNLLSQIVFAIPQEVQLARLENRSGTSIEIEAKAQSYHHLGFFISILRNDAILNNVTATPGVREGDLVRITITGDLVL